MDGFDMLYWRLRQSKSKQWETRRKAAEALGNSKDPRAVRRLMTLLWDRNHQVRIEAALALGKVGHANGLDPVLELADHELVNSKHRGVRRAVAIALGEIGDTRAIEILLGMLEDKDEIVRTAAVEGLIKADNEHAVSLLESILENSDKADEARKTAELALAGIGSGTNTKSVVRYEHVYTDTFTINAVAGEHGSILPSGEVRVKYGKSVKFTMSPDLQYRVEEVLIDGEPAGALTEYTFENVTTNQSIEVRFAVHIPTVTAKSGEHGSISPAGEVKVASGTNQEFTIKPDSGYSISELIVDGNSVEPRDAYTFLGVIAGHTIEARFAANEYKITARADANGSISPCGAVRAKHGESVKFSITPNQFYHVENVLVDDKPIGDVTEYAFDDVVSDQSIEVRFAIDSYTITVMAGEGGGISPSGEVKLEHGGSIKFTITPAPSYHVENVFVDGESVGAVTEYSLTEVAADHNIEVRFALDSYIITASARPNGNISPSGEVEVNRGEDQTFAITPAVGYHVSDVLVDGKSVGAMDSYTFMNVTANHSIEAEFAVSECVITATAGANGSVSPAGDVRVGFGADQTFIITPNAGYEVSYILVDNISIGQANSHTFSNVSSDHTIEARFYPIEPGLEPEPDLKTYMITVISGAGGSVSPSGEVEVDNGASVRFTIEPEQRYPMFYPYRVLDVLVDGKSVGAVTEYTFENVTSNHTLETRFGIEEYTISISSVGDGSISPSGEVQVKHGENQTFMIQPADGCLIGDVIVDGESVGSPSEYAFKNIAQNHTISVSFIEPIILTIAANAGENGIISPSGNVRVEHGEYRRFRVKPDDGYTIEDVMVDGRSVGSVEEYAFKDVTESHSISASFAPRIAVDREAKPRRPILRSLSLFIFCGLGQVYKGEVRKGIGFMVLYSLLILSFIASRSSGTFMRFFALYALIAMWVTGIIDFYLDEPAFMGTTGLSVLKKTLLRALKTFMVLNIAVSGIVIAAFWTQYLMEKPSQVKEEASEHERDEAAIFHEEIEQAVSIVAYSLEPTIAHPGDRLTIRYKISVSKEVNLGLACSIRRAGAVEWMNDPRNDKVINADPGTGEYYREFALPATSEPGIYSVGWGVWSSDFSFAHDFKLARNSLIVAIP